MTDLLKPADALEFLEQHRVKKETGHHKRAQDTNRRREAKAKKAVKKQKDSFRKAYRYAQGARYEYRQELEGQIADHEMHNTALQALAITPAGDAFRGELRQVLSDQEEIAQQRKEVRDEVEANQQMLDKRFQHLKRFDHRGPALRTRPIGEIPKIKSLPGDDEWDADIWHGQYMPVETAANLLENHKKASEADAERQRAMKAIVAYRKKEAGRLLAKKLAVFAPDPTPVPSNDTPIKDEDSTARSRWKMAFERITGVASDHTEGWQASENKSETHGERKETSQKMPPQQKLSISKPSPTGIRKNSAVSSLKPRSYTYTLLADAGMTTKAVNDGKAIEYMKRRKTIGIEVEQKQLAFVEGARHTSRRAIRRRSIVAAEQARPKTAPAQVRRKQAKPQNSTRKTDRPALCKVDSWITKQRHVVTTAVPARRNAPQARPKSAVWWTAAGKQKEVKRKHMRKQPAKFRPKTACVRKRKTKVKGSVLKPRPATACASARPSAEPTMQASEENASYTQRSFDSNVRPHTAPITKSLWEPWDDHQTASFYATGAADLTTDDFLLSVPASATAVPNHLQPPPPQQHTQPLPEGKQEDKERKRAEAAFSRGSVSAIDDHHNKQKAILVLATVRRRRAQPHTKKLDRRGSLWSDDEMASRLRTQHIRQAKVDKRRGLVLNKFIINLGNSDGAVGMNQRMRLKLAKQ